MRGVKLLLASLLGVMLLAASGWTAEAAEPKMRVAGEAEVVRPELENLQGVTGWKVNGQEIPLSKVQEMGLLYHGPYLLQDLVVRTLLEQAATRDGITVTDDEVVAKAKLIREETGLRDDQVFDRFLRQQRITPQAYLEAARTLLYVEKVVSKEVTIKVSDAEIEQVYNAERTTTYRRPETLIFRAIGSRDQKAAQNAAVGIKNGSTFKAEAKKLAGLTDVPDEQVEAGNETMCIRGQKDFPQDFENVLFNAPLNQVIGPVELKAGLLESTYVVFRVEKKADAHQFTLSEVRDLIRERIFKMKVNDAYPGWLDAQLGAAEIVPLQAH